MITEKGLLKISREADGSMKRLKWKMRMYNIRNAMRRVVGMKEK